MITQEVYKQLQEHQISENEANRQYLLLTSGAHFMKLNRAAILGDGILPMPTYEAEKYASAFDEKKGKITVKKFVPASGAASRMFKDLIVFESSGNASNSVDQLLKSINKLAFAPLIPEGKKDRELAGYILNDLNYQSTPKGLIPFHAYNGTNRTPFEEHWLEGVLYAQTSGSVDIHFTVSEEHYDSFKRVFDEKSASFKEKYGVGLNVSYSYQDKSTDTIAIDGQNNIVVQDNGNVLLRPGGHGALIENLNAIHADLVFVKNIDNVTHESRIAPTVLYKKALAGLVLELKDKVFELLNTLELGETPMNDLEQAGRELMISVPNNYDKLSTEEQINFWKIKLNRPIRVCGMVKNEGEPGGGPFWVDAKDGASLQIVESAQIDRSNEKQESILQNSTHFNPVDLVCYLRDYKGNKFNLTNYVDESAAFITSKSANGKEITVLERPGLWNGAMADWITVFVETPIETFNPVKTVNDLLKPAHQGS